MNIDNNQKNSKENPIVYITLPCYNWEKYLLEQLMSIYNQNYTNWYLIFVNDWSTDSSEKIVKDWISHYNLHDRVKILYRENGWLNAAITTWLEEIMKMCDIDKSDSFVCFCDCDDIWTREKISLSANYMISHPEYWLTYHDMAVIDSDWVITKTSVLKNIYHKDESFFTLAVNRFHYYAWEMLLKVKYLDKIVPLPVEYSIWQDHRIGYNLILSWVQVSFIDKPLMYYRRHSSNMPNANKWNYNKYMQGRLGYLKLLQKNYPDKDISYEIWYIEDRFVKWVWENKFFLLLKVLFKYPRVFFLLLWDALYYYIISRF